MSTASQAMHTRALVGTKYRTYKRATDKLAAWLAATAQVDVSNEQHGKGSTHGLTIAQFISLTDQIIEMTPRVEIPLDILNTAEKVFLLRQERSVILGGVDAESDIRHQYVVAVMAEVFQKLTRHHQAPRQVQRSGTATDCKKEKTLSSFQLLDIEVMESSEDDSTRKSSTMNQSSTNKHRNMKKKMLKKKKKSRQQASKAYLLDVDEDRYFVLMCLLSDLKSMREYIKEVWQEYRDGKVDLITASLTTNATFDIIRTYQDDFPAISTLLSDYSQAVRLILSRNLNESDAGLALFFKPCTVLGKVNLLDTEAVGQSLSTIPQVADLIFANAFYFLNGPRHAIVKWNGSPRWEDMHRINPDADLFGKYQPEQSRDALTLSERFREDLQILANFAKVVYISNGEDGEFFKSTWDHITLQWRDEFGKTGDKTITLSQAFGAQIYLDIHHTLRQDINRGAFDLFHGALKIVMSYLTWKTYTPQEMLEKDKELKQAYTNLDHTYGSLCLGMLYKMLDLLECGNVFGKLLEKDDVAIKKALGSLPNLELNPLLSGVVLFDSVHSLRDEGTYFAQYGLFLIYAGQIYYGCQMQRNFWKSTTDLDEKGLLFKRLVDQRWKSSLVWKDMDYMLEMFGPETFFDGFLPKTNIDIARHFGNLVDLLYTNKWWKDKDNKVREGHFGPILTDPKDDDRHIKFQKLLYNFQPVLVTHRLYYSKYFKFRSQSIDKSSIYDWTLETLQTLLENHLKTKKGRQSDGKSSEKDEYTLPLLKDDKEGNVSQVTILRTLKEVLQSESRALNFDYLALHTTCFHFLLQVKEDARNLFCTDFVPGYDSDECVCKVVAGLQAIVNASTSAKAGDFGYVSIERDFFTNSGHFVIDESVKRSLEETDWSDKEIKKLNSIWGIPPA